MFSLFSPPCVADFENGLRARDGKCVFTGIVNCLVDINRWAASDAAHIPPLEKESFWVENNFSLWITNEDSGNYSEPVNAIQNGFFYQVYINCLTITRSR